MTVKQGRTTTMNDLIRNQPGSADEATLSNRIDLTLLHLATTPRAISESRLNAICSLLVQNIRYAIPDLERDTVAIARVQALSHPRCLHPRSHGATLIGLDLDVRISAEWAAWANTMAVLSTDDTSPESLSDLDVKGALAPTLIAVAQQCGATGDNLVQGLAVACAAWHALSSSDSGVTVCSPVHAVALSLACGIGRCLQLHGKTIQHALVALHTQRGLAGLHVADIARRVICQLDASMRLCSLERPANEQNTVAPTVLNHPLPSACLEDEHQAIIDASQNRLTTSTLDAFINRIRRLPCLTHDELMRIYPIVDATVLENKHPDGRGIF